ncbi:MAG TPA: cation:proton antiporter [Longimicrobiales bacterium]
MHLVVGALEAGSVSVPAFLSLLIVILVSAKVFGGLAERIGQPAVLGELVAGVLLGSSALGVVDPDLPVIHLLAEVGVIVLLFQIGLETDLKRLISVGGTSLAVATAGVVLPFAMGYGVAKLLGLPAVTAVVSGAALTATSVGITARVLSDLGRLREPEGEIVLGAAVIDDIVGLVILAVVGGLVAGTPLSLGGIASATLVAFGFVAAVLVVGRFVVPPTFRFLERKGGEGALATMALALAFLCAVLADRVGSAFIIGAFAAGLVLGQTPQARVVEHGIIQLGRFFVPIFFIWVGAAVDVRTFGDAEVVTLGAALTLVAVLGKVAAGYVPFWFRGRRSVIGVGMVPRGEVGLIFAQMGLASGVLTSGQFSAIALVVMVTTLLAPPLLKMLLPPKREEGGRPRPPGIVEMTTEA